MMESDKIRAVSHRLTTVHRPTGTMHQTPNESLGARGLLARLRAWLARRRLDRQAVRLVAEAFRAPELLRGTSLEPRHASRWVLVDREARDGKVVRIRFGILRHPRPYAFSRQSHKVVEYYLYHVEAQRIERLAGLNVTRLSGRDADD